MKMQTDIPQVAFLLSIPPVINTAEFFFLAKLIAGGIFYVYDTSFSVKNFQNH